MNFFSSQQFFQARRDLLGRVLAGEGGGEAAFRVHHIDDRGVVHRIVAAGLGVLGVIDPVFLGRLTDRGSTAGQRQDRRVERRDIVFERLRGVALGVDRDEDRADVLFFGPRSAIAKAMLLSAVGQASGQWV